MIKPRKVILFILLFRMLPLFGQQSPYLDHIQISEHRGKVYLHWVMSTGAVCDGIDVYRSADGMLFERVGRIPGICGSPEFAVAFDFVDELPLLNQLNHYRLEMGNLGVSPVVSTWVFDYSQQNYQLIPNPIGYLSKLYFPHQTGEKHHLFVFDIQGRKIMEMESSEGHFQLSNSNLAAGNYTFLISQKQNTVSIKGKMVVVK